MYSPTVERLRNGCIFHLWEPSLTVNNLSNTRYIWETLQSDWANIVFYLQEKPKKVIPT